MVNITEIWAPVIGYEGIYEVSNLSRIKSIGRFMNVFKTKRFNQDKILSPSIDFYGYAVVCLRKGKKGKVLKVHRIVANSFIPNPQNKPQINHINGIKSDNRIENLEWCNNSENQKHSYRILGKKITWLGEKRQQFSSEWKSKIAMSKRGGRCLLNIQTGVYYDNVKEAAETVGLKRTTLNAKLCGQIPNNTYIRYV